MRILDHYILKSVLAIFLGCLLLFFFLYIIIDVFSHLEDILKQKVQISILLQYYLAYLPIIFVQISPVACLLSVLYTFGKLNRNNEIIAMRSSGLSIFQITKTVIIFAFLVSICVFWVNDKFLPSSLSLTEDLKEQMEKGAKKIQTQDSDTISGLCIYGLKNRLFFVNKFSLATNTMEGITILEHDEKQNITKKIVSQKAVFKDDLWTFHQSITYYFNENGQILGEAQYLEEEIMPISEAPKDFLTQRQQPEHMDISQLDDYIWRLSKSGAIGVIRNLKTELFQRFTLPLTSTIMVLLGIPFSLRMKKRATGLASIGLSLMVGFLYYVLNAVSIALGKAGIFAPSLSATFPHLLSLIIALYLIHELP